jgi:outer membrane protein insertion porin family
MFLKIRIVTLIFILTFITFGQQKHKHPVKISSVEIEGNKVFNKSQIIQWSGITAGRDLFPGLLDSVKSGIAANLARNGFVYADFSGTRLEIPPDSQNIKLIIDVNEGKPSYINKIFITYTDSIKFNGILDQFEFLEGQIFDKNVLEEAIHNSLSYFENNGYPFAKIIISSIIFFKDSKDSSNLSDIHLKIDKGIKSKIDKIEIAGNKNTKDYVIKRALRIDPGELYSQKKIDQMPAALNRLSYFEPVGEPEFFLNSKNEGILLINVKEKQTNNFDGIIGYIPSTIPGQAGYLTGLVNVSLRNLFGTGRAAAVRWQQFDRYSQELELKYLEPWIFNYPFNLTGDFSQRKQDTSYVQRKLQGGIEFLATENVSASFFVSSESVIPTITQTSIFTVYNSHAITTGVNLTIDTRDDPYAPTSGILFDNSYSFSKKTIYGPQQYFTPDLQTRVNFQRIEADFNIYRQFFKRQIAALGLHGKELSGPSFEVSDLYRLGGTNSLRGYREDQFLGSRIFWSNLEYRLLLTRRSYTFVFFDTGYFFRKAEPEKNILKSEGFKTGYGLGLNIETGLGILGVSFALGQGDSFSEGKIHFGIVNEF